MTDRKEMPADGGGRAKGEPDGVSGMPDGGDKGRVHGHVGGGESSGGFYPNPHSGKESSGSPDHGGQTEIAYHGGDNPNATTSGAHEPADEGSKSSGSPVREAHSLQAGAQRIEVVEDSGIAAAEATGKIPADKGDKAAPGGG